MKTFHTLYKRTKTGAIQYWKISVGLETYPVIYKESGQLGTDSPIQHKEEIREGKNLGKANETTPAQQAVMQAESDWRKKRDEGYKSRLDLNIDISGDLMHYSVNHVHYKTLTEALNATLPQFNTDASGNVKPMLATDWTKVKIIPYPCYIQPKLDGVRCLIIMNDEGDIIFLSRSGKPYTTLGHIREDLERYYSTGAEFHILDGEIYSEELSFQEITAAVKKQRDDSLKLHFRAYDVISNETQEHRIKHVGKVVDAIQSPFIHAVDHFIVHQPADVKVHHDKWVQEGYEGAMLRLFDGMYGQGQRSRHLLKVKEFDETEFRFLSWETGQREEDLIAVLRTSEGKDFRAKMVGTRTYKEELKNLVRGHNEQLTVKHFGWTDEGLPRFPIGKAFRED